MPRLAIFNMLLGFVVLFLAACAGAFIGLQMTEAFMQDQTWINSWQLTLLRSAHGHTNLFGILHIALGLTLPYSLCSPRMKLWQTIGLGMGTLAMGPGMIIRASLGPSASTDVNAIIMGVLLSAALLTLATHAGGLTLKFLKHN